MRSPRGLRLAFYPVLLFGLSGCGGEVPKPAPPPEEANAAGADAEAAGTSADGGVKRIIILTNGNSPYWDACRAGVQDADRELQLKDSGLTAVLEVNDGTPQGQIDKLRQFGSQSDIAGIGISAIDANNVAIADEMRKLQEKGIKVVTVDSDVDRENLRDARFAFIGTDNSAAGRELGVCARNLRPEGGGYVTFVGRTGAQNAIERVEGFGEGAGPAFELLDNMGDDIDKTRARDNVRNAIQNHADKLTTLVGIWSYNAPAIVDIVKETGTRDKFTIVCFDAEPTAIAAMADGNIDALMVQNPYQMGYQGVRLLKALTLGDDDVVQEMFPDPDGPDGDVYDTGLKVVVPQSSPLKADLFGKKTEFLPLDKFRNWLAEYDLEGS